MTWSSIVAVFQMVCVFCWLLVWTSATRPAFGLPMWAGVLFNFALFVSVSISLWRGRRA